MASLTYGIGLRKRGAPARSRGIYLLPNLITSGALFSGFYAIVASMNGNFEAAAMALLRPWSLMRPMGEWRA